MEVLDFIDLIADPRQDHKVQYSLSSLLFTTLCGILCGCQSWRDIHDYCEARQEWLSRYIDLSTGVPSLWTFRRLFTLLNPTVIESLLMSVSASLMGKGKSDQIAIDGKYLRHSKRHDSACLKSVSAWCHEHGLVLAEQAVAEGSHETAAIPLLLASLLLKGTTVTIDAAGTNPIIAAQIITQQGNYVLALKKNQPKLHQGVTEFVKLQGHTPAHRIQDGFDDGHGRTVRRRYFSYDITSLEACNSWPGLKTAIAVETISGTPRTPVTAQWRYYLSSHTASHPGLAQYVRNHWSIENKLHWVLDVQMHEDNDLKAECQSVCGAQTHCPQYRQDQRSDAKAQHAP